MIKNNIIKPFVSIAVAICLAMPASPLTAVAAEANIQTENKIFIPFRDQIPFYLSTNSSMQSDSIKAIWTKVFYEEMNWNENHNFYDPNFGSWWEKYNTTEYIGLGGIQKKLEGQITFSAGDFEAFLGNSLEANPEFLGQLLGLDGYQKLSTSDEDITLFRNIIGKYLLDESDPTKYDSYFVNNIVNLTKDGAYLNDDLKTIYCNGIRADYCMLNTLAARYRKTNIVGEQYLSEPQIRWIESYQEELYDAYTKNTNELLKNLVSNNDNLYDLIARSSYAANDRNGYGQTFFDYVVESGKGAGAWLNLNDNINIPAMAGVDDISSVFALSDGWCGDSTNRECYKPDDCTEKATANDIIAYSLYKNPKALAYIQNNETTNTSFGTSKDDSEGWWHRYTVKHTKWGASGPIESKGINAASGRSARGAASSSFDGNTGTGMATCSAYGTIIVRTKDLLYNPETKTGSNAPKTVTVGVWYEASWIGAECAAYSYKSNDNNKCNDSAGYTRQLSFNCSSGIIPPSAGTSSFNYTGASPSTYGNVTSYRYYTFDVSHLSLEQLKTGYIQINTAAGNYCYATDYGFCVAYASCGAMPTVYITCPVPDCDINGHAYDERSISWAPDFSYADITYSCTKDKEHVKTIRTKNITASTSAGIITYKALGKYNESYTKVVSAGGSENAVTSNVTLTNDIATDYYKSITNTQIIDEHQSSGYLNTLLITQAASTIKGSVKAGVIPVGVQKITFNYVASEKLEEIIVSVLSPSGQVIGRGGSIMSDTIDRKNNTITVVLYANSDIDLYNSYVTISGKATTKHVVSATAGIPSPSTAVIGVTSMKFTY
ncbi:hypothetical protein NXH64_13385 [Butyrivibrio fibrisolvens]|uniref:hypothetical protein n=1 Tax=Pseudobutyrivibrio ruminis TaxID=46206 RepID=UPI0004033D40|nr:hypothetical protein [Pseudobutyrivibrio ruminis]MDC7280489.1 hypothetical protein [Butyrivibrio fibrisolvens]